MRRHLSLFIPLMLACAGGQSGATAANPAERQKIVNLVPFDIANCFPSKVDLGKTANEYTLQAAFRASQPTMDECMVDGRNLTDPNAGIKGKLGISLDANGTTVTSEGLPPAVQSCVENALKAQLAGVSAPAGGKPFTVQAPVERDPTGIVRFGVNESSDAEGTIRLALPQMCDCFGSFRTQAPPMIGGSVKLVRADYAQYADRFKLPDGGVSSNKTVTSTLQSSDPAGAQMASCVNQKVEGLPLKTTSQELTVPTQVRLVNSGAIQPYSPTAEPALQFLQMDAVRQRRQAEALAALTRRQGVANRYDGLVQQYQTGMASKDQKKKKAADALVPDLKSTCATLLKADDEYTQALDGEAGVEQQAVQLAQALKAKDPSWAEAEKASTAALAETQKQIEASKQLRASNDKACPKEHK